MPPEGKGQFIPEQKKPTNEEKKSVQSTAETTEVLKDKLLFDEDVKRFIKATVRNANRGAIPEADEDDVAQEVKTAVWRRIKDGKFDQSKAKLETYLYQAIHNKFIDLSRRRKNRYTTRLTEYNFADPKTPIEDWIKNKYITSLIVQLPISDQEVLKLKSEGYTNKEIGEKLIMPTNTAGTKYARAIEKLKKIVAEDKKNNAE